jgi:tetratricopeptide (TPR) repeat protein
LSLVDGLEINVDTFNKAKNNDAKALRNICCEYTNKIKDHSKAMNWYQLAINQNETVAYNDIGIMYYNGFGVSRDYITAMEYFLKVASGNNNIAMSNIGLGISNGKGAPADKYKALEWFAQNEKKPENAKELNQQGIHLKEEDKSKSFYEYELCYLLTVIK